jgi:hypothetical protein
MSKLTKRAVIALAVAAVAAPVLAQDNPINQLGWLAGMWRAEALGGQVEDVWTPATNGEMLSTMRAVQNGKAGRYEFRSIRMIDGKLTFQELGFGGDLKPAAGPPLAALTTIDAKHAVFGPYTFETTGPNTMVVTIQRPAPAGPMKINYTRAYKFAPG